VEPENGVILVPGFERRPEAKLLLVEVLCFPHVIDGEAQYRWGVLEHGNLRNAWPEMFFSRPPQPGDGVLISERTGDQTICRRGNTPNSGQIQFSSSTENWLCQIVLVGVGSGCGTIRDTELGEEVADVAVHGSHRHDELVSYVSVGQSFSHQA